jgi:dipeptidase E
VKLVLYSGGTGEQNRHLDRHCIQLTGKKYPRIAYIPACSFDAEVDFKDFVYQFASYDITQFIYFPIDIPFDRVLMKEVLKSDVIHLSGGNTFYFLNSLRKARMLDELHSFVMNGGVLTGLSAGAILMTPSIHTAGFPSFDRDINEEGIKNLAALNLVPFEIFPHYKNSKRYDLELKNYSLSSRRPLYALPDGSGLIMSDNMLSFVGKAFLFSQGSKTLVNR